MKKVSVQKENVRLPRMPSFMIEEAKEQQLNEKYLRIKDIKIEKQTMQMAMKGMLTGILL